MLAASELTVWRGTSPLFQGLSFRVPPGSALVIKGQNGAGKTTLLRVIAGLTRVEEGTVTWRGKALARQRAEGHVRLAFAGHSLALKGEFSARENLHFFARLAGWPGRVPELLQATGLGLAADLPVRLLSAGQKRRVGLAQMLLCAAELWLLDEPQTHLDGAGKHYLEEALQHHLARGGTALVAAHQPLVLGTAPFSTLTLTSPLGACP